MAGQTHESGVQIKFNPLGHFNLTVSTVAIGLPSMPDLDRIRRVVIRNVGQSMTWRDDGTDPTPTTGMHAKADEILVYDGSRADLLRFIRAGAVDADCRIAYYGL